MCQFICVRSSCPWKLRATTTLYKKLQCLLSYRPSYAIIQATRIHTINIGQLISLLLSHCQRISHTRVNCQNYLFSTWCHCTQRLIPPTYCAPAAVNTATAAAWLSQWVMTECMNPTGFCNLNNRTLVSALLESWLWQIFCCSMIRGSPTHSGTAANRLCYVILSTFSPVGHWLPTSGICHQRRNW